MSQSPSREGTGSAGPQAGGPTPSWPPPEWRTRPPRPQPPGSLSLWGRLAWIASLLLLLAALRYFGPPIAEQVQYAMTRGRQRAELETAAVRLGQIRLRDLSHAFQLVSQRAAPAVVHVRVTDVDGGPPHGQTAARSRPHRWLEGQGAGVIVDPEGYIVTNRHVVHGSEAIQVQLSDGRRVPGRLVGEDAATDLAVLKVDAPGLTSLPWGDSDRLAVGELVWTVGSPFGLEQSVTSGIVSGKHRMGIFNGNPRIDGRTGNEYQDFIQTDAPVNPGSSGGPLVDADGRLVGINTAIVGEAYQGISFAIPSNVVRRVYEQIRATGKVVRGFLGVSLAEVTEALAQTLHLPAAEGAYVLRVAGQGDGAPPSPALRAGIRPGDVIVRWNGQPIRRYEEIYNAVGMTEVGAEVDVVVYRGGKQLTFRVTVGRRPE